MLVGADGCHLVLACGHQALPKHGTLIAFSEEEDALPLIEVQDLTKTFKVAKHRRGFWGAIQNLVSRDQTAPHRHFGGPEISMLNEERGDRSLVHGEAKVRKDQIRVR